jgi:exopolysaccharide biosynthesis polyprenyl glycosylphosphotransferase
MNNKPQFGFRIAGIVSEKEISDYYRKKDGVEIFEQPKSILGLAKIKNIKGIITAFDPRKHPELIDKIYECLSLKISFSSLANFSEQFAGKIPVNSIGQVWFLENLKEQEKLIYEFGKRIFDIFISIILLIISIPFLPFIFLAVKLNSKGSFFFMQQRTGRNGKRFMAIKLRSMYVNSESNGPQWAQKNDPRVTSVGKFMRKTRIDEIPQLINIFRGEMSFIGPRPERPEFIKKLEKKIPFYNERLLVKPGLTGWAQINFPYGASEADALQKLQYDLYYIKNRSLLLDLSILLKTIKTVLSGGGQ